MTAVEGNNVPLLSLGHVTPHCCCNPELWVPQPSALLLIVTTIDDKAIWTSTDVHKQADGDAEVRQNAPFAKGLERSGLLSLP